jgi:excisionase family DNA binding protein
LPELSSAVQAAVDTINNETLSVTEAAALAGISAVHMHRLIRMGRVPTIRVLRTRRICRWDVPPRKAAS